MSWLRDRARSRGGTLEGWREGRRDGGRKGGREGVEEGGREERGGGGGREAEEGGRGRKGGGGVEGWRWGKKDREDYVMVSNVCTVYRQIQTDIALFLCKPSLMLSSITSQLYPGLPLPLFPLFPL